MFLDSQKWEQRVFRGNENDDENARVVFALIRERNVLHC